jgi:hypothetical protein
VPKTFTAVALLVRGYDERINGFTRVLGSTLSEDTPLAPGKRQVRVAAEGGSELLPARAATPEQQAAVGRQAGGRVGWFLHTDDFDAELAHLRRHDVHVVGAPRDEAWHRVVVFHDLYGNPWASGERPRYAADEGLQ